jgi:iron complex outermembrane receptor protein
MRVEKMKFSCAPGSSVTACPEKCLPHGPPSSRQSYTIFNALAGYSWLAGGRRVSVELAGRNLGDATYRPSQSTRSRPREVLLTLRAAL